MTDRLLNSAFPAVWLVDVPTPLAQKVLNACLAVLDAEECERAATILNASTRDAFVIGHALLRHALAETAHMPAKAWRFSRLRNGKPTIADQPTNGWTFSLSHTDGLAACAIARGQSIGIDVEALRPIGDLSAYAKVLSATEISRLNTLPAEKRRDEFWAIWTAKEAVAKAAGQGLAMDLSAIEFPLPTGDDWALRPIDCGPAHVGTLAMPAQMALPRCRVTRLSVTELIAGLSAKENDDVRSA